jgi:D-xylose 1-dehydrogenase (NADP+, D-xylono-1,5-lactone-forming)
MIRLLTLRTLGGRELIAADTVSPAPVSLGFLSTAKINELLLAGARASERVRVLAVASRDEARAASYARTHGIERPYGSYEELLADPDVEAVYVPLPNSLHVDWSLRALAAGKHVLCEKPFSRRSDEVEHAFDAAEGAGLVLMEAFMYRHHPQTARIEELVREGAIGRLRAIRAAHSFDVVQSRGAKDIRLRADLDGGALMDVGCYCLNSARLLAGEPVRVWGEQVLAETGVDMTFHGVLRFAGDVVSQFQCSFALPARQELELLGDEGSLLVQAPWRHDLGGDVLLRRGREVERIEVEEADSYRLQLDNLAAAVRGETPPLLGREDAVAQAGVIAALYESAEAGRAVVPSLRSESP